MAFELSINKLSHLVDRSWILVILNQEVTCCVLNEDLRDFDVRDSCVTSEQANVISNEFNLGC